MAYSFRPAVRENVNLLIGLAGGTGSGKTFTGMRLASGMAGGKRFAVIDTENGRASHYADQFAFDVAQLHAPFTPEAYTEAILAADAAGYPVIMVDSMSHEYAGEGGVLDMQEAEFVRMSSKESAKVASWIKPKGSHKKMVTRLLQVKAHLILCFRAEPKIEVVKVDGKTKIIPKESLVGLDGWIPVAEKNLPYELTVSLLFTADKPGIPKPIKLQKQHRALFPLDTEVTEESGRAIAAWAAGAPALEGPVRITSEQVKTLKRMCEERGLDLAALCRAGKVDTLNELEAAQYNRATGWIERQPRPVVDEASILLKIDGALDRDAAAEILDSVRDQPWAPKVAEAFKNRWEQRP